CYAVWTPDLPTEDYYEVFVYIPFSNATSAAYRVRHAAGEELVFVNQKEFRESWVSLGTFWFEAGGGGYVRLGDKSNDAGQEIIFDAVRWSRREAPVAVEPAEGAKQPSAFALHQNSPNPFNPLTRISYALPSESRVTLEVYNALGQRVATLVTGSRGPGLHSVLWDSGEHPSGVYFYRLRAVERGGGQLFTHTKKMVLAR
ncbi:MAG: T9SS type A sorting domain-containing protein, partial [Bacteroidota bacterium]